MTTPDTPQHSGVAKRMKHTLVGKVRVSSMSSRHHPDPVGTREGPGPCVQPCRCGGGVSSIAITCINALSCGFPRPHAQYQILPSSNDARPTSDFSWDPATKTLCGSRRRRELKRTALTAYSQPLSARRQLPADLG